MDHPQDNEEECSGVSRVLPGLSPHILPGILRDIAEVAGIQAAMDLCAAARGGRHYFPTIPYLNDEHPLTKAVGRDAALRIAQAFGGEHHTIPTARPVLRAYRARLLRRAGYSTHQIAVILDMDRSHVIRIAPGSECPPGPVDERAIRAILDDAPQRFADMRPARPAEQGED